MTPSLHRHSFQFSNNGHKMKSSHLIHPLAIAAYSVAVSSAFVAVTADAAGPPNASYDGGGRLFPAPAPLCTAVTVTTPYPQSESTTSNRKMTNLPSTHVDRVFVDKPAIPAATVSWSLVASKPGVARYCVRPSVVNTGTSATATPLRIWLTKAVEGYKDDLHVTTKPAEVCTTTIGQPVAPGQTVVAKPTWCVEAPVGLQNRPKLMLYLGVPEGSPFVRDAMPDGSQGASKQIQNPSQRQFAADKKGATGLPNTAAYASVCRIEFAETPSAKQVSSTAAPETQCGPAQSGVSGAGSTNTSPKATSTK